MLNDFVQRHCASYQYFYQELDVFFLNIEWRKRYKIYRFTDFKVEISQYILIGLYFDPFCKANDFDKSRKQRTSIRHITLCYDTNLRSFNWAVSIL